MPNTKSNPGTKRRVPKWASSPFKACLVDLERQYHMVRLSASGIAALRGVPRIIEVLTYIDGESTPSRDSSLKNAKEEAELARRELSSGFPILHAWAVVGLWGRLEALIRVVVAEWLRHKKSVWQIRQIQGLRIRLGEYESLPKVERALYVAEMLEKELGAGLRNGATRFEALLEPFGLSGKLPAPLTQTLYELGQVRNVIAHRNGRVDRQFTQACPWLGLKIGTDLQVSAEMFQCYYQAVSFYVTLLICRVGEAWGVDMSEPRSSTEERANGILLEKATSPEE